MRCKKCLTIFQGDVCPRCGLSVLKDADFRTQNSDIDELEAAFLDDFKDEIEENKKNKQRKMKDSAAEEAVGSSSDAVVSVTKKEDPKTKKSASSGAGSEEKITVSVKKKTKKTEDGSGSESVKNASGTGRKKEGSEQKTDGSQTGILSGSDTKKVKNGAPSGGVSSVENADKNAEKNAEKNTETRAERNDRSYDDQVVYQEPDRAVIEEKTREITKELKPLWERGTGEVPTGMKPRKSHKRPARMPLWKVGIIAAAGLIVVGGAIGAMHFAGKDHSRGRIEAASNYPDGNIIFLDKQGNLKKKTLRNNGAEETILDKAVSSVVAMDEKSGKVIYLASDALWYYDPERGSVMVDNEILSYNVSCDPQMNALIYTKPNTLDLTYDAFLWTPDRGESGALCLEKDVPYVEHFRFSEDGSTVAYSVRTGDGAYQIKRIKTFTNVPAIMMEGDDYLITYDLLEDGRVLYYDYSSLTLGLSDGKKSQALARQSVADLYVDEARMIAVYLTEDGDACSVQYGASPAQAVKLSYDVVAAAAEKNKETERTPGAKKEEITPAGDAPKVDSFESMTVVSETPQVYRATALGSDEVDRPDEKYLILTKENEKNNDSYMIRFSDLADHKTCLSYLGHGIWYSPQICSGDLSVIMDGKVVIYPGLVNMIDPVLIPEQVSELAEGRDSRVYCRTYQAVGETLAAGYDDLENLYGIITNDTEATSSILLRNVSWYETNDGWIYCLTTDGSLYLINGKDLVADPKVKVKTEKIATSVSQVISLPQN